MEALAQDLNSALEESTASSSHKRKSCKRRKKKNEDSFGSDSSTSSSCPLSAHVVTSRSSRSRRRRLDLLPESDSFNESSVVRPRPKRKIKRSLPLKQSQKRKKIRTISSEMKCIRPGKRPRSTSSPMDVDEEDSSGCSEGGGGGNSSDNSSFEEEEEEEEYEEVEAFPEAQDDDRGQEADDEQSDWPGALEDDEGTPSRARVSAVTVDKRREIRSGRRKHLAHCHINEEGGGLHHQMNRFLRDPSRMEIRLHVRFPSERNAIVQFANCYSLSLRVEGLTVIRMSKSIKGGQLDSTSNNNNNQDGLFLIPGNPACAPASLEFKRRRKTPPPPPNYPQPPPLDMKSRPMAETLSPASKRRTHFIHDGGSPSS